MKDIKEGTYRRDVDGSVFSTSRGGIYLTTHKADFPPPATYSNFNKKRFSNHSGAISLLMIKAPFFFN